MVENATIGLVWLAPDNAVVIPRGQLDQPALQRYATRTHSRARRVRVELRIPVEPPGRHAGEQGVEIWLDGRHVGELTTHLSRRYGRMVGEIVRRGERVGAEARVVKGHRGTEMEIHFPELPSGAHAAPPVFPAATAPARRRTGWPLVVGAGVVLGLVVISTIAGGNHSSTPTTNAAVAAAQTTLAPVPVAPAPAPPVAAAPAPKPPIAAPFTPTRLPEPPTVAAEVEDVAVYDHAGDRDNERRVDRVIDSDLHTTWRTSAYFEQFPKLKPGVGIMLSFPAAAQLTELTITSPSAGTVVEIRSAPTADPEFGDTILLAEATLEDGPTTVSLADRPTTRHLLVWITKLGDRDAKFVTEINEIQVRRTGQGS